MTSPTLVVGWDGAPFNSLRDWLAAGELPNLAGIATEGYFGPMETTPYVMSPCAWSTFLTGQDAGSHGVFDFYANDFRDGSYFREPIDARARDAREIWEIFQEQGRSVGAINVPVTYPAEADSGFMISGVLAPSADDEDFAAPEGLLADFDGLDDYLIDLDMSKDDDRDKFLARVDEMVERRTDLIKHCIREGPEVDVVLAVFTAPDRLSHYFWHFQDECHPHRDAESESDLAAYDDILLGLFQTLDEKLGEIRRVFEAEYGTKSNVGVVSDHGMESLENVFLVNEWLAERDYLAFTDEEESVDPGELPSEKEYVFGKVDWENTQAYSIGKAGEIYINLEGREPQGSVPQGEYEAIRESICEDLRSLTAPGSGEQVVDSLTYREDLFNGPYLERAPDVFVDLVDSYYSLGYTYDGQTFIRNDCKDLPFVTGIEDKAGIFVHSGPEFESNADPVEMGLVDYLPTLLHALDMDVPDDLDGDVVLELARTSAAVEYREGRLTTAREAADRKTSEEVKDRLKDLGYF